MASHKPKLNVYTLRLKNIDESVTTFRDLIKVKYNLDVSKDDKYIFELYFQKFLDEIGKDNFRKHDKSKKVMGVYKSDETETNFSISLHYESHIIEGMIDGGKYGISREYADIDKKDKKRKFNEKNAILDKFYFLLYTPLNSQFGILLIQSYTEETIQEPFKDILAPFFSLKDYFFNLVIEPFVPQKFVDKFAKEANVRLFSFSTILGLDNSLRNEGVKIDDGTFEVVINIKPKAKIKPSQKTISKVLAAMGLKKFDNKKLDDLEKKVFLVSGDGKRKANFDLQNELQSIRPTIYLEDEGIKIDPETSTPNFDEIKKYCFQLLNEVKAEYLKKLNIDEF